MSRTSVTSIAVGAALLLAGSFGCAQKATGPATVLVDGSSTVYPLSEAVAEEFGNQNKDVRVTVGLSGTGGGFKKFGAGEIDVTGASRPIKPSEVELCTKNGVEYIELPVAYDGLAVMVNPKNTWASDITVEELRRIWEPGAQGKVMRWSDVRPGWPDRELHLYGPGVDSGTYDYFTAAVVGTEHSSRGDYTSSEDDNVIVQGIAGDELALGFFGYAYYGENKDKLKLLPVDDGKADNGTGPIAPSPETVMNGTYQPLSRPIFIYASKKSLDRKEVASFVQFYIDNSARLAQEVGHVQLPDRAYVLGRERLDGRVTGTLFGGEGSQVGMKIDQLMEQEQAAKH